MSLEEIEKGGFPYFMLKEIFEQPKTISDSLRDHKLESMFWGKVGQLA